jgi:hypothetical protein
VRVALEVFRAIGPSVALVDIGLSGLVAVDFVAVDRFSAAFLVDGAVVD